MSYRVVIDPGVIISSVLEPLGNPAKVIGAWHQGQFELIVSRKLLVELEGVLCRPRLQRRVSAERRSDLIELLEDEAISEADPPLVEGITRDPKDDYLASLVLASHATHLVTGDRALGEWAAEGVAIVTPREFLDLLTARS